MPDSWRVRCIIILTNEITTSAFPSKNFEWCKEQPVMLLCQPEKGGEIFYGFQGN